MANLLGFLAAGATKGIGEGLAKDAESRRQEFLEKVREQRADGRAAEDRAFRTQESATEREWRAGESEANRAFQAEQGALERSSRASAAAASRGPRSKYQQIITDASGNSYGLTYDGKAEPILGPDAKPIVTGSKGGRKSTEWQKIYNRMVEGDVLQGRDALDPAAAAAAADQEYSQVYGVPASGGISAAAGGGSPPEASNAAPGDAPKDSPDKSAKVMDPPPGVSPPANYPTARWYSANGDPKAGRWIVKSGDKWHFLEPDEAKAK